MHEYQQLARIVACLDDVRSTKIEAMAHSVGYQSAKNFYGAFRRVIGRTPGEYRVLPDEQASLLKTTVAEQLTREAQSRLPSMLRGETALKPPIPR